MMTIDKLCWRLLPILAVVAGLTVAVVGPVQAAGSPPVPERSAGPASAGQAAVDVPAANPVRVAEQRSAAAQPEPASANTDDPRIALSHAVRRLLDETVPATLVRHWQAGMDEIRARAESEAFAREQEALSRFYATRKDAPVWVTPAGATDKARALVAAMAEAPAYGLDPGLIPVPEIDSAGLVTHWPGDVAGAGVVPLPVAKAEAIRADRPATASLGGQPSSKGDADVEAAATTELALSRAALIYARHARGGRILKPAQMLNSNLDRKPQLLSPVVVLADLAEADDMSAALAKLHPVHPQFERLRQAFLAETGGDGRGKLSSKAERIRANMEFWRWMWDDLGELYIFNNIPEFMQTVVRGGKVVRREKIVVGEIGKQSSVFSRPLQEVVLRPRWRVPESIMVYELWPSLRRGGGLMRQHGLEITTKSGEPRDWRQIDWTKDDIRNYHVWQPPGRKSALGFVKFSFPSQHTIFMHDTPDKWMFNRGQRTLSHGCLRVKNPMELTDIVLDYDRGWDRAKIKKLIASGPLDNKVEMQKHIPVHLAYFTAWADADGKVRFFRDIYGHEKRVRQALDGDWKKIHKGRNHLAKPVPRFRGDAVASAGTSSPARRKGKKPASVADMISEALGF